MTELLRQLESALLLRNPGLIATLQPPLDPDHLRKELSRVGIKQNIDPILTLYAWHNGTKLSRQSEAFNLGFAPPSISTLPKAHVEFLAGIGQKVDPHRKLYDPFHFAEFAVGLHAVKLWKKYAKSLPESASLTGRFFPFMSNNAGELLAFDLTPEGRNRIVLMTGDKHLRRAYDSLEHLLQDLIHANQTNQLLSCIQSPGQPLELPPPPPPKATRPAAPAIPVTDNPFLLRTDFASDAAWTALQSAIQSHDDDQTPTLDFISDPTLAGTPLEKLRTLLPPDAQHTFAFVADATTLSAPDRPILVVELSKRKPRSFRVHPAHLAQVSANLSLANLEFADFANASKPDGLFRGFPDGQ